jgi:phosphatidylserine/phosphatidylglycerophosphate/cardiolipin synthase-like enzyme
MTSEQTYELRRIFKSSKTSGAIIRELLQMIFIAELLQASKEVWIVSPWISNVPIIDNRGGYFDVINPEWGHRKIRLGDLALHVLSNGAHLTLVTRPDDHNVEFLDRLEETTREAALNDQLNSIKRENLHTKGILTGRGLLFGSMNLTYNGFTLNDEVIEYDTSGSRLTQARHSFKDYLDGERGV